jgi:hypothetical protein
MALRFSYWHTVWTRLQKAKETVAKTVVSESNGDFSLDNVPVLATLN